MKKESLNVGAKVGTEKVEVACAVNVAESFDDIKELSKGNEAFAVKMFNRGWRIWNQEQTGARDFVAESTIEQRKDKQKFTSDVQNIIDNADPNAVVVRSGRKAGPKEVKLEGNALKDALKDPSKLAELLAAQGVKLEITK